MRNNLLVFFFLSFSFFACEKQRSIEEYDASADNNESITQRTANEAEEEACVEGDLECLEKKAKKRAEEASDDTENEIEESEDDDEDETEEPTD